MNRLLALAFVLLLTCGDQSQYHRIMDRTMKKLVLIIALLLGLATPTFAQQSVVVPATTNQIAIAAGTLSATKIVSGVTGKQIYVTQVTHAAVATSVITYTYGTGTNCGTGTTALVGVMTFAAAAFLSIGNGYGAVWVVPSGQDLCLTIGTAGAPGSLAYSLF